MGAATESLFDWQPVPVTIDTLRLTLELTRRYSLSWKDAMIVAAALLAGCLRLYSEDLQDGSTIDGMEIVNPFRQ